MTATCEVCREKPASVRDFALRAGRWVQADVCEDVRAAAQAAPLAVLGVAAAAAAVFGGAALAIDAAARKGGRPQADRPTPRPQQPFADLGRMSSAPARRRSRSTRAT